MRKCPFCGSDSGKIIEKTVVTSRCEYRNYYVRCNGCFSRGPVRDHEAFAVMAWDGEYKNETDKTKSLFKGENNE